jgi:pre-mRNA-splicing factor SYF1
VDADRAIGKPHSLWCTFAKLYERHGDIANARIIFEKAVQVGAGAGGAAGKQCKQWM